MHIEKHSAYLISAQHHPWHATHHPFLELAIWITRVVRKPRQYQVISGENKVEEGVKVKKSAKSINALESSDLIPSVRAHVGCI